MSKLVSIKEAAKIIKRQAEIIDEQYDQLTALQSKLSKAEADNDALFEAAVHLNHFVPKWAEDVPEGLCPTMYGTGDYERDLDVKRSVDKSRDAIDKAMQNKG